MQSAAWRPWAHDKMAYLVRILQRSKRVSVNPIAHHCLCKHQQSVCQLALPPGGVSFLFSFVYRAPCVPLCCETSLTPVQPSLQTRPFTHDVSSLLEFPHPAAPSLPVGLSDHFDEWTACCCACELHETHDRTRTARPIVAERS
jgi:hypothetical protein